MALKSTASDTVIKFDNKKIVKWEVLCDKKVLRLCVATTTNVHMRRQTKIRGCIFERSLELKDCQEALILLNEEEILEGIEPTLFSYCFPRDVYGMFDQKLIETKFLNTAKEVMETILSPSFPITSPGPTGENIEKYITAILEWSKKPFIEKFHVGKKETIEKDAEFASRDLPKVITVENMSDLFRVLTSHIVTLIILTARFSMLKTIDITLL